jgi:FxsC-like protein
VRQVPVSSDIQDLPYFLMSYPHTERNGEVSWRESDEWVIKFYMDLSRNVEELAAVPRGTRVGVLDRDRRVEDDWGEGLPEALALCRVLVPLYSHRYFESDACGREWSSFVGRLAGQSSQVTQAPAIVPVMWMPVAPGSVPPAARAVPIEYGGLDSYAQLGLASIMKLTRYRTDYGTVVRQVAQRVLATARRFPAGPWPVADFGSLPNPFAPAATPQSGAPRLLITVVASHLADLPAGRGGEYYGMAPWDWAPYRPASDTPIAEYTANFARSLGCRPYVSGLQERADSLLIDGSAAHPELLIIDPWAVTSSECQRLLARFNLADKPWIRVVIPWNPADGETAAAEKRHRLALDSALRLKLECGRVTAKIAVEGVLSISDFGAVLPLVIHEAWNCYLGNARAFPPVGSVVEKPTLDGFTPDPPNRWERAGA